MIRTVLTAGLVPALGAFAVAWLEIQQATRMIEPELYVAVVAVLFAAGGLMVAVIQAAILLGAVIGGWLLDGLSIQATFVGSVILAAVALGLFGDGRRLLKPVSGRLGAL
jgi:predicted MFS family arabinose efflux permease